MRGRQRRASRSPSAARRRLKATRAAGSIASRRARAARRRSAFGSSSIELKNGGRSEKRHQTHKARSRDGRWTVIPGAYVSRWEPYAEAHEPRQGQPPGGSYGPEECCPDAPPSSAFVI